MVKRCAWGTCNSDTRYPERLLTEDGKIIKFHSFPSIKKHKERREIWIRSCCRGDGFECKKDSYICSLHFVGQQGPTKEHPNPVPANANKEKIVRMTKKRKAPKERIENTKRICKTEEKSAADALLMLANHSVNSCDDISVRKTLLSCNEPSEDTSQTTKNNCDTSAVSGPVSNATQTAIGMCHLSPYADLLLSNKQNMRRALFVETVLNPTKTHHYTGLEKQTFLALFELIKDKAARLYTWKGKRMTRNKSIQNHYLKHKYSMNKMTAMEQMILVFVRLRRKPSLIMLADLFGISASTVSRTFISWVLFLRKELMFLLPFSTVDEISGIQVSKPFKDICNIRGIVDCTEFYIEKPFRIASQRSTYSSYKSRNTFKAFISISPLLHINFISNLYSGSISDKEIVRQSGFLQLLNPGDLIMADKGFNIQDLLAIHYTRLLAPPIMKKGCVSANASTATRRIARARVHVERIIRKLKCFSILRGVIPLSLKPYINSVIKICAAIVNLEPSIIDREKDDEGDGFCLISCSNDEDENDCPDV